MNFWVWFGYHWVMTPLADRLRPQTLDEYTGQKHIISPGKLLYTAIKSGQLFSMIFWGPPGVGKTTLARVIANEVDAEFIEFSAVSTGIAEIKKLFEKIKNENIVSEMKVEFLPLAFDVIPQEEGIQTEPVVKRRPIVFIDEIHRFNKAQQDAFLPYVENGTITLIGATTENPSFEVIGALLSRTRVFVLQQLQTEDLIEVIDRALKDSEKGLGKIKIKFGKNAIDTLIDGSNGDARQMLNALEIAATKNPTAVGKVVISHEDVVEAYQSRFLNYDKAGEEHYNTISAFIKSMRSSNIDAALYYLARMVEAGEDPKFIARRMVIFASEDIGMAQPTALVLTNEVFKACETIGYPECQINLAHGVAYLASAKKDRSAYEAYFEALADVKAHGNLPIPMNLRNAPTKLMKESGYRKGYQKYTNESLLPGKLKEKRYFKKKD